MKVEIISYDPKYDPNFYELNKDWLQEYFYVEAIDKEILSKPGQHIINPGGFIFFMKCDDKIIGTLALMPTKNPNELELSKMAISSEYRGNGLGNTFLKHAINFCRERAVVSLILYSNTKLRNAIHLYRKFGFEEVQLEPNSPYKRSDIKMKFP